MIFEKAIVQTYKNTLCRRYDGNPCLKYFSHTDFKGLNAEPFEFSGSCGQLLRGNFYYYGERSTSRLVIFDHGMGGGHDSYMREIQLLANHGFTVFSYDKTGCKGSEGERVTGFAQSVCDLDYAVRAIRALPEYEKASLSVIGHSWGAFAALNIPALHPDIEYCVALSGPLGARAMVEQFFSGIMKGYVKAVFEEEKRNNPHYAELDAVESLKDVNTRVLVIHSKDDPVVSFERHFETLRKALSDKENIEFLAVDGKKHNPNYTSQAVALLDEMNSELNKAMKKKSIKTPEDEEAFRSRWDFMQMTEQDEDLWGRVLAFMG